MQAHKLIGLLRYAEDLDDIIIVVDGLEYPLVSVEIDEYMGALYLKAGEYETETAEDEASEETSEEVSVETKETPISEA
jgi:hypothetical protein